MPFPRAVLAFAVALPSALTGCVASLPMAPPSAVSASEMRPEVFFAGRTRGVGRMGEDGAFRLDQTIARDGRTRHRAWAMRRVDTTRYAAALTDAHGPVTGTVEGPVLRLRYWATAWGAVMRQTLTLLPGDTAVDNRATVRFLGLTVARLHERIVRVR